MLINPLVTLLYVIFVMSMIVIAIGVVCWLILKGIFSLFYNTSDTTDTVHKTDDVSKEYTIDEAISKGVIKKID